MDELPFVVAADVEGEERIPERVSKLLLAPKNVGTRNVSMGGLMALYTGLRAPQVFGRVLSQSAALDMSNPDSVVFDLVRYNPLPPLRIWMNVGRYEWLLDSNRRMHELLVERGYDIAYCEYNGGHNYASWRDTLWQGLETMFGS